MAIGTDGIDRGGIGMGVNIALARARYQSDVERREAMQKIRDYYQGDQINSEYVPKLSDSETPREYATRLDQAVCVNLTAHIADSLGMTLKKPPKIEIEGFDGKAIEAVQSIIEDEFFALQLQEADIMTCLLGSVMAQPRPEIATGGNPVTWWYPDYCEIVQSDDDPLTATEISVAAYRANTPGGHGGNVYTYTRDTIVKPDGVTVENPYQVIPFVQWRDSLDPCFFWPVGKGERLIKINHSLNCIMSDIVQACLLQGFSSLVTRGMTGDIKIGFGAYINLGMDENASASYITPDAKIMDMIEAAKFQVQMAYSMFGLKSQDPLRIGIDASSGTAILMSKADAFEYREKRAVMLRKYIMDTVKMMLHVYAVEKGMKPEASLKALETTEIEVTIAPPDVPVPSLEQTEKDRFGLEIGTISPVDIFLRDHPGWDRDEAIEELARIAADTDAVKSKASAQRVRTAATNPISAIVPPRLMTGQDDGEA